MIKRYYSMFNCNQNNQSKQSKQSKQSIKTINQNNHSYQKSIKYYLWLQRRQTNNISIAISFGFQNFSENSLSACVKQNKL